MIQLPVIEIGKKYLWKQRVEERDCPSCGHVSGSNNHGKENVVIITSGIAPFILVCTICGYEEYCDASYYGGQIEGEEKDIGYAIPYTQLQEIKENGL